jgi:acetoin utilization protein AcuB
VRHVPIVDDEANLVGMLSDRDLGAFVAQVSSGALAERDARPSSISVGELMSADVFSVNADAPIQEVVDAMLEEKIGAVPVVDAEGKVAGIVSYVDLLRLALSRLR